MEKVRSRSLAMHHSEELSEVVTVLFEGMKQLGITFDAININTIKFQTKSFDSWLAAPGQTHAICLHVPYFDNPVTTELFNAYERGDTLFSRIYPKEEKMFTSNISLNLQTSNNYPTKEKNDIGCKTMEHFNSNRQANCYKPA